MRWTAQSKNMYDIDRITYHITAVRMGGIEICIRFMQYIEYYYYGAQFSVRWGQYINMKSTLYNTMHVAGTRYRDGN